MKNNRILLFISLLLIAVFCGLQSCVEEKPIEVKGNIEGAILDMETGEPIGAVNVTIVSNSNTTFIEQSKLTGSDGKFSFKDIEAGSFKLTFLKDGYENNSKNINLTAGQTSSSDISLKPIKSELKTSVTQLDFGQNTNSLPVEITNIGKGTLDWSIVEDLTWLSINPTAGKTTTEKSSITVTVDRAGMPAGAKSATFIIKSNGGSATITISLSVAGPILSINPLTLNFGETEIEKTLNLSNTGVGSLTYTAAAGQSWITLTGGTGSTSTEIKTIKVTINRAGLSVGSYAGSIIINSNSNSIEVPVSMVVSQPTLADVLNGVSSGVTYNSAQVSGNIISLGSSAVTQRGHCWSTSPNTTTSSNKTQLGGTNATGAFTSNITGLSANTTYYVKAYATNGVGTKYSDEITFTTLAPPTMATVKTMNAESVKHNQAEINGDLTVLGDGLVTDYGFCYSKTNASPTISDSKSSLGSTTQIGNFKGTIAGLSELTKYYVRAYAVNSLGTAYGSVIEITTNAAPPLVTNGLLAYYNFDNNDCSESQGNVDFNGLNQGGAQFSADKPNSNGYSIYFDGVDDYVQIVQNPLYNLTSFSFNFWIKTTVSKAFIFSQKDDYYNGIFSGVTINNGKMRYYYHANDPSGGTFSTSLTSTLLNNQWHMITISVSTKTAQLFIDGNLIEFIPNPSIVTDINNMAYIGAFLYDSGYDSGFHFKGHLDNFRIYSRALVLSEIKEIYNAKQ